MYCRNCGKEIDDQAVICPNCGVSQVTSPATPDVIDNGGFGWGLLGCCVPVVGLILFLVWKDTKPRTSKAAGIGALVFAICFFLYIVFNIVIFLIGVSTATSGYYY